MLALQVMHFLLGCSCCGLCCMQLGAQLTDLSCQVACLPVRSYVCLHVHHPNHKFIANLMPMENVCKIAAHKTMLCAIHHVAMHAAPRGIVGCLG